MFYSSSLLSKKGALGTIWIASHLDKRLKRSQIFDTSIPASVDSIINPEAPLALRLSGQLLLGIVRVYLRKLEYLNKDAQSVCDNLSKSSTQGANVDLEDEGRAAYGAITLADADEPGGPLADDAFMFQGTASEPFSSRGAGPFQPAFSAGESLTPVADVSDLFGSHWGIDEERFEASGEEINRRFSIELERLRAEAAAPPPDAGNLFFQAPPEEDLVPVPDDLLDQAGGGELLGRQAAATPAKTPTVGGAPLPGTSDIRITPPSLGLELLPDVAGTLSDGTFGMSGTAGGDTVMGEGAVQPTPLGAALEQQAEAEESLTPAQRRRQQQQRRKKKAAQVDKDSQGQPETQLPFKEIRALLSDRASLLTERGVDLQQSAAELPPDRFDVAAQVEEARSSLLFRPAASLTALAPEIMELYGRAMGAAGFEPARPAAAAREAAAAAAEEAATPQRSTGMAAEEERQQQEQQEEEGHAAPTATQGTFSGGDFDFASTGLTPADDYGLHALPEEDLIEPPDTQRGAAPPAGPLEEEEGAAQEALGAARRHSLAGEQAEEGGFHTELGTLEGLEEREREEQEGSGSEGAVPALPQSSFTQRSRAVLAEFKRHLVPGTATKRHHPSQGGLPATQLSLDAVVRGKSRTDACRWFYEALVLRNNDFVELEQREPYGDITIRARPKMVTEAAEAGKA